MSIQYMLPMMTQNERNERRINEKKKGMKKAMDKKMKKE